MDRKKAYETLGKTIVYCITYATSLGDDDSEDVIERLRETGAAEVSEVKILDVKFEDLGNIEGMSAFTDRTTREKK